MADQSREGVLLNNILGLLERQSDALVRVGLQALVGWTLALVLVGGGVIWGMRRWGGFGASARSRRVCTWALGLMLGLLCWPLVVIPATGKAVALEVRDIIAGSSDALGLTIPVGQAVMSPITKRMWDEGLLTTPLQRWDPSRMNAHDWVEASALVEASVLLDPEVREALLSSLTPERIWAQGEPVRASVLASKHPLPDWAMRDIVEHGHGLLTQDLTMYRKIAEHLQPEPTSTPLPGSGTEMVKLRLSLQSVARQAGEMFFRDYTRPLVEAFMGRFVLLGLWGAVVSFGVSALLCFALTRPRLSDRAGALPPELDG